MCSPSHPACPTSPPASPLQGEGCLSAARQARGKENRVCPLPGERRRLVLEENQASPPIGPPLLPGEGLGEGSGPRKLPQPICWRRSIGPQACPSSPTSILTSIRRGPSPCEISRSSRR